jgi:hypothetical protein
MATSILQSWVARCRDNFTTTSATAVLVTGTRRYLTGLTAGSYLDISAEASFAIGAAADAMAQVYLGATAAAAVAIAEGTGQSVVTAADYGSASIRTLYGPLTTAEAASGLVVDLRIATSADTLSITAITTPTRFGATLRVDEVSLASAVGLPSSIPNCLLWLKAGDAVYDKSTGEVTSWADAGPARYLGYDGGTANFTAGLVVTGGTSGATATIHNDNTSGSNPVILGTLVLTNIVGTFADNEAITDSSTGAAVVNGTLTALPVTVGTTAPVREASVVNSLPGLYFDGSKAPNVVLSGVGISQATSFVVFAVVSVSASLRVGASLLNPAIAAAADCLRVTLSNASVNRNALLDTGKPEYISTTTTVTSGKALMRWRYNVGTTTGAAAVNGNAEVTDTSFDPPAATWAFIGSSSGGTYALPDFRLCELVIFSNEQAATEDAISISDTAAVRDYLNSKYGIY